MLAAFKTAAEIRAGEARAKAERIRTGGLSVLDLQRPRRPGEAEALAAKYEREAVAYDRRAAHLASGRFPLEPKAPPDWANLTRDCQGAAGRAGVAVVDLEIPAYEADSLTASHGWEG